MKHLLWIFMALLSGPLLAGVGSTDGRRKISDTEWAMHPYNKYVLYKEDIGEGVFSSCTAQYVAPNILLTAAHCIKVPGNKRYAESFDHEQFEIELLKNDQWNQNDYIGDWALLSIKDSAHHRNDDYFDYKVLEDADTPVISAGFGTLKVLSAEDISKIQNLLQNAQTSSTAVSIIDKLLTERFADLFNDGEQLKAMECTAQKTVDNRALTTTCDIWGGNSGGAIIDKNESKYIYGINHSATQEGIDVFLDDSNTNTFVSTAQFKDVLDGIIKNNPSVSK